MLVTKQVFSLPSYTFENGERLPVRIGFETYGELNDDASNAILICHYFSGTSHAAGKYSEDDELSGWWDDIIGPGKPFDTNRYFIVCADLLCNLMVKSPLIVTTGPSTIDPATGKPYGM